MPLSAQALYFHLNMRADDDGFINNTARVLRYIKAKPKDLRVLIDKRFLISFDNGVIALLAAENLDCTVGNNFVGVHIGSSTCAALDGVANKLVMEFAADDLGHVGFPPVFRVGVARRREGRADSEGSRHARLRTA